MRCLSMASVHWIVLSGLVAANPEPDEILQARMLRSHSAILEFAYAGNHISNDFEPFGVAGKVRSSDGGKETSKKSPALSTANASKVGKLPSAVVDRAHAKKAKQEAKDEMKLTKSVKDSSPKSLKTSDKTTKPTKPKSPKGCRRLDSKSKPRQVSSKKAKSPKSSSKHAYSSFDTNSTEHMFGVLSDKSSRKSSKVSQAQVVEETDDDLLVDCEPVLDESSAPTPAPKSFPPFAAEPILESDEEIVLEPYHLFLSIEQTRIPLLSDYEPVTEFTDEYLDRYFGTILVSMPPQLQFKGSKTELSGSEFRLAQPVRLDFTTTLYFEASSLLPDEMEVQALLAGAFEGSNGDKFASLVASSVDEDNIFVSTSAVVYATKDTTTRAQRVAAGFAMYALNAVVVILVVVGLQSKRTKATRHVPSLKSPVDYLAVARSSNAFEERTIQSATSMHEIAFSASNESSASEDSGFETHPKFRIIGKLEQGIDSDSVSFNSEDSPKIIQRQRLLTN